MANLRIFQAIYKTTIPPPNTAQSGRSKPNIIIFEVTPLEIITNLGYNNCVLIYNYFS
jgi:hypothetical protein